MKAKALFFVVFSLLCGCKDDNESFYFANEGVITGTVYLDDSSLDLAGTTVVLKGSTFAESTTTNQLGQFRFRNVPTSNYEVHFEREGFGEIKVFNIKQSGLDTVSVNGPNVMFRMPTYAAPVIRAIDVTEFPNGETLIEVFGQTDIFGRARVFIGTTPEVSYLNYDYTDPFQYMPGSGRLFAFSSFNFERVWPGIDKVYTVIYSDGGGAYFDPLLGRWVFSALNKEKASEVKVIQLR